MAERHHFFVRLLGTRPDWPENMTDEEAVEIMRHEPSVVAGVHAYEIQPMRASLVHGRS